MSTVTDILNSVATRINDDANLYSFINMAVRMIAKRLYQNESSIVKDDLEVDIFAEVEYAASTIAFVEGDTPTITDSASQFVIEGFEIGMWITTDDATNPGPFKIVTVEAGTLTIEGDSTTLSNVSAGTSITITSQASYSSLPDDFWGLMGEPYIDGKTYPLMPLPSLQVQLNYTSAGEPRYYEIKGNRIYVVPATSTDYTIKGDYFARPDGVTDRDSTVPYYGFCDDIIAEAVVMFYAAGAGTKQALNEFINEQVDSIVGQYDRKGPTEFAEGIDWNAAC